MAGSQYLDAGEDTRRGGVKTDQPVASMGVAAPAATPTSHYTSSVTEPAYTNHPGRSSMEVAAAVTRSASESTYTDYHANWVKTTDTTSVSVLEGAILKSHAFFPYYMLLSLEAGGPVRAFILLLLYPLIWAASALGSEALSIHIMVFISFAGLKLSEVGGVAKAVLPKFYMDDINQDADEYSVFLCSRHKYVLTSHPRVMVEHFLSSHLGVEKVVGTELQTTQSGYCTGLVGSTGVLLDDKKLDAAKELFGDAPPDVGFGSKLAHKPLLCFCREGFMVSDAKKTNVGQRVVKEPYLNPLVFHDGRLVLRPNPIACIALCLWAPFGLMLGFLRLFVAFTFPHSLAHPVLAFLGIKLRVGGSPPLVQDGDDAGILYVCTHRTPADPLFLAAALGRPTPALTYSLSRLTEFVSPIPTARLTRNRQKDAEIIRDFLRKDDLIMCPEGTTCREPFLLRFSSLFADVADRVVPVAVHVHLALFHATSARGYKYMDPVFLLLNPQLVYHITFLEQLPMKQLREAKSSIEIANHVQKQLADYLGFQCTKFTRRDKYTYLAGTDGTVKLGSSLMF